MCKKNGEKVTSRWASGGGNGEAWLFGKKKWKDRRGGGENGKTRGYLRESNMGTVQTKEKGPGGLLRT